MILKVLQKFSKKLMLEICINLSKLQLLNIKKIKERKLNVKRKVKLLYMIQKNLPLFLNKLMQENYILIFKPQ